MSESRTGAIKTRTRSVKPPRAPKNAKVWQCPECVYRIETEMADVDEAIAAHWLAHNFPVELGLERP